MWDNYSKHTNSTFFVMENRKKNLISRLSTLPALFMDIWPQYRALRVLWFRFVKEDLMKTRKERRNFEHNLNQTGK